MDSLCRRGKLNEILSLLPPMPPQPNFVKWYLCKSSTPTNLLIITDNEKSFPKGESKRKLQMIVHLVGEWVGTNIHKCQINWNPIKTFGLVQWWG